MVSGPQKPKRCGFLDGREGKTYKENNTPDNNLTTSAWKMTSVVPRVTSMKIASKKKSTALKSSALLLSFCAMPSYIASSTAHALVIPSGPASRPDIAALRQSLDHVRVDKTKLSANCFADGRHSQSPLFHRTSSSSLGFGNPLKLRPTKLTRTVEY